METKDQILSVHQFRSLDRLERQKYLANKSKKQLQKICKAYGLNTHGGAFALAFALTNFK